MQQSRFLFSLSRDGLWTPGLNRLLTAIHPRFQSPWTATLAVALVSIPLCFVGEWTLLVMVSGQAVVGMILVSLGTLIGRRRNSIGVDGFRSPLFPALGLLIALGFGVGGQEMQTGSRRTRDGEAAEAGGSTLSGCTKGGLGVW